MPVKTKKIVKKAVKKVAVVKKTGVKKVVKAKKAVIKKVKKVAIAKVELAQEAKLVTHQEWAAEQLPAKEPEVIAKPVQTTPAYTHIFRSVPVATAPKKKFEMPAIVSMRERVAIIAGVAVFTLMIGGMWLKITSGYFQTHKFTDESVVSAANLIGEGFQQIKNTKEQLVHDASAAVEIVQTNQNNIEEANKALGEEVQKLLDQKNNNQVPQ